MKRLSYLCAALCLMGVLSMTSCKDKETTVVEETSTDMTTPAPMNNDTISVVTDTVKTVNGEEMP